MTTKDTTQSKLSQCDLEQFNGDMERYRTLNPQVIYTPGVQFLAERGEAFWLIDLIASYYGTPLMRQAIENDPRLETLHFWSLEVRPDGTATAAATADTGEPPFIRQEIPYTDFPLSEVRIWSGFDGRFWTLYLPSEH